MHMADALLSPPVGGVMWAATAAAVAYSSVKVKEEIDTKKIPLMGVLGAFIFAAQMINFTIPGTGSSGHIGGGMILAIILGPYAGFLTIASVLTVQALFFADGGLLALGCNIFNLGVFPCFIAYPLIYKTIAGKKFSFLPSRNTPKNLSEKRQLSAEKPLSLSSIVATMTAVIIGLQLGALAVIGETVVSGISVLSIDKFMILMLPIHLAIGCIEGIITVLVVQFIWKARPEILDPSNSAETRGKKPLKTFIIGLCVATLIVGGAVSWFASTQPDGLEWSIFHTTGEEELESPESPAYLISKEIQEKTAILPDYGFKADEETRDENTTESVESKNLTQSQTGEGAGTAGTEDSGNPGEAWPAPSAGTTVSGAIGSALTILVIAGFGFILYFLRKKKTAGKPVQ
jgi:cobalt/nickel transport system permease protein